MVSVQLYTENSDHMFHPTPTCKSQTFQKRTKSSGDTQMCEQGEGEEQGTERRGVQDSMMGTIIHPMLHLNCLTTSHMGEMCAPIQDILMDFGSLHPHIGCLRHFLTLKELYAEQISGCRLHVRYMESKVRKISITVNPGDEDDHIVWLTAQTLKSDSLSLSPSFPPYQLCDPE